MHWFYNLKIAAKLIIGFLVVAAIAAVVGIVALVNINNMSEADVLLYEENTLGLDYSANAALYYQGIRFNCVKMLLNAEAAIRGDCIKNTLEYSKNVDEYLKLYEEGIISETDRKKFAELKPQWEEYKSLVENATELAQSDQIEQAQNLVLGDIALVGNALQDLFSNMT